MDYTSTLETLEGFLNAVARHCTNQVVAWAILYAFVKVRKSQKLLIVVWTRRLVHSTLILNRCITQVLQRPFNVSGWLYPGVPNTESELGLSSTCLLRLVIMGIAHFSQRSTLFTLSQLLSMPYRCITQVLWRPLKVSGILYPCVPPTESELWQSSSHWLRLVVFRIAHGSQQCALFTLSQLLRVPYRLITRVL